MSVIRQQVDQAEINHEKNDEKLKKKKKNNNEKIKTHIKSFFEFQYQSIQLSFVVEKCLKFCLSLLCYTIKTIEYDNALICALAVLRIKING